ncbi:hypothetical protein ACTFIW_002805 [Dictyostelium discoideum]
MVPSLKEKETKSQQATLDNEIYAQMLSITIYWTHDYFYGESRTQILYPPNASVDFQIRSLACSTVDSGYTCFWCHLSTWSLCRTIDAPSQRYCLINNVFIASLLDSNINTCAATTAAHYQLLQPLLPLPPLPITSSTKNNNSTLVSKAITSGIPSILTRENQILNTD